jgi:uncharacterized membrane protein
MTKDAKYSIIALLSGILVSGLLFGPALAGIDLTDFYRRWFGFVLWTGFVFGLVAYHRRRWLKKAKALMVFVALLTLHIVVLVWYLGPTDRFPNVFFLIFSPLEAALVALVVGVVGGNIGRRRRPGE